MKYLSYFLSLFIISIIGSCASQKNVVNTVEAGYTNVVPTFEAHNAVSESVVYALPKTMLRLTVHAKKVHQRRGPLYRYSDLYLNISDVVTEDKTEWHLNSVDVQPIGIVDETKLFKVNFSGNTGSGNITTADNGCIRSVNLSAIDEIEIEETFKQLQKQLVDTSFTGIPLTEDLLRSNALSKMAEEAASFIYRIRENRVALVSAEVDHPPTDGESLNLSLKRMDELEKQFVSLFIGKTAVEVEEIQFDYVPKAAVTREILFRFSRFKGLVPADDFSGSPVLITLTPDYLLDLPNNAPESVYDEKGAKIDIVNKNGFFYRLPMASTLELNFNGAILHKKKLNIAQFGKMMSLPADLLDRNNKGILFNSETGAIKKIVNK